MTTTGSTGYQEGLGYSRCLTRRPAGESGVTINSDFKAHPLLRNRHVQTIWSSLCRSTPPLNLRLERVELPNGDFFNLGWAGDIHQSGPIAVLVHGYAGGLSSKYLRGLARRLIAFGWRVAIVELRGGTSSHRSAHLYHHGDTADLRRTWALLREREPLTPVAVVGWSLGGSIVLNAVAEEGDRVPLFAAAAACVPFRLEPCAEHIRHGFARVYQKTLLNETRAILRHKHATVPLPPAVDWNSALRAKDFVEFDSAFTAPLHGFRDARDYYAKCECGRILRHIKTPTLIVNSADDPLMAPNIVPAAADLSASIRLEITQHGGHLGFVAAGRLGRPLYWLENRLFRFLIDAAAMNARIAARNRIAAAGVATPDAQSCSAAYAAHCEPTA
jgi:predicted alpha/beta-fold hydrolase